MAAASLDSDEDEVRFQVMIDIFIASVRLWLFLLMLRKWAASLYPNGDEVRFNYIFTMYYADCC